MAGYSGFGTTLSIAGTPVAELTSISGPTVSADSIDVTSHGSTNAYREFVAGLIDGGEISMEGNLTTAVAGNIILTAIHNRAEVQVVITFPAAAGVATWTTQAIVTGFETDAPHDDKLGFSATIKVTGRPVLA